MIWLSIIVPSLNEAQHIIPVLTQLQSLRKRGVEVIVVDGGSTDGTPALAAPLTDRVLATPPGRARQMNAGAALATGVALLFLHADTRLPDDALRAVDYALNRHRWGRFDVRFNSRRPLLRLVARMMNLRSRLTGIATGDQAMFMTRAAFESVGGFPEQALMEDIELSRRLKKTGSPACLKNAVITSARRWEEHGTWRTIVLMWRLRWAYWRGAEPAQLAQHYNRPVRAARS
ncbi:TIGR04283 family arsenosugar biosynthesis glycosyltransferase [Thiobacillus sp.]|uniref:TIGR04283 family arsenosugar biosynthesis glycosyltransferase n=1 Tax=Thiobacillus sp. TaxID=924 RepID=UPI0011DB0D8D|nr:TIGR04283 family arsenosugar biosynthesis glycosyltransferase [Thiobacillus sp.]TXH74005.1 MAG: glycosyltransferase [Thiobacillus sp.]